MGYTLQHHLVSDINYPLDCKQLFIDKTGGIIHRGFEGISLDGKTTWKEIVERGNQKFKISFTPHLSPMFRGILSTIYVDLNKKQTRQTDQHMASTQKTTLLRWRHTTQID